jgi:hypothetical protein
MSRATLVLPARELFRHTARQREQAPALQTTRRQLRAEYRCAGRLVNEANIEQFASHLLFHRPPTITNPSPVLNRIGDSRMLRNIILGAAVSTIFATMAFAAPPARVYELRVYHANPGKLDALHSHFRDHTCKLFQKHGMEIVGFWTPMDDKNGKGSRLYYMLAFPDSEAAKKSWGALRADPEWQKAKAEGEKDGALVNKVESTYLDATDYSPAVPTAGAAPESRVYELRTYVASPGKFDDLHKRFRDHTMAIFKKHDMTSVGYWVPQDDAQGHKDTLIYLLSYPSRDAAAASWKAFGADPEWQKVYKESQPDNVPLAAKVTSVYLAPTNYPK